MEKPETTLELKKVKISDSLSEETVAFTGELWVNGKLAARCSNHGTGGPNDYHDTYQIPNGKELVKVAEEYCKGLPAVDIDPEAPVENEKLPMDLEFWISLEIEKIQEQKEAIKQKKKFDKLMINHLVIGNFDANGNLKGNQYFTVKLSLTIEQILKSEQWRTSLTRSVQKQKALLKDGERILNVLPEEVMNPVEQPASV